MEIFEAMAYLETLLYIALADGTLTEEEMTYFRNAGLSVGLSTEDMVEVEKITLSKNETFEEIVKAIKTPETKVTLLKELLALCYADFEYSLVEKNGMRDICILLGFDMAEFELLEKEFEGSKHKYVVDLWEKNDTGKLVFEKMSRAIDAGKNGTATIGKKVTSGGVIVAHSVAAGIGVIGSKITFSLESAKKVEEENKILQEKLKTDTVSEAVKQKVILQLNCKIKNLSNQLKAEKQRNKRNEELIRLLQVQLDKLSETVVIAQNAKMA